MASAFERLASILAESIDRTEKARALAECIRRARSYHWVGLYDVGSSHITAVAWTGQEAPAFPQFPRTQGLNGAAVQQGTPVVVQDVSKDPRWLTTFGTTRAEAIFPVRASDAGAVVGTIDVESERVGAFGEEDVLFLTAAARAIRSFWHLPG